MSDADMLVASWGMEDGRTDAGRAIAPSGYDWDGAYPEFDQRMRTHGLVEKSALNGDVAGYAERVIGSHDYAADGRTPVWIRERFGFARERAHTLARLGVRDALREGRAEASAVRKAS
jgi:hypothetical protein